MVLFLINFLLLDKKIYLTLFLFCIFSARELCQTEDQGQLRLIAKQGMFSWGIYWIMEQWYVCFLVGWNFLWIRRMTSFSLNRFRFKLCGYGEKNRYFIINPKDCNCSKSKTIMNLRYIYFQDFNTQINILILHQYHSK